MTPVLHTYTDLAGKTVYWDTSDSQQLFEQNKQDPAKYKQLADLGYIDSVIEYTFNKDGFRSAEFDSPIDIACFGCSFTMGTGVHAKDTWPQQLSRLTGLTVANLGHAGSSNDTAFRMANHYLKVLKPTMAIWLQTDLHRIELLDQERQTSLNILASDTTNPCRNDYFIKTWFVSAINQHMNFEKNTRAFRHLCSELGIKLLVVPQYQLKVDRCARDLMHPGPLAYQQLSMKIRDMIANLQPTS